MTIILAVIDLIIGITIGAFGYREYLAKKAANAVPSVVPPPAITK